MAVVDQRVCARCGDPVGDQRFCGACGLNISEQEERPSAVQSPGRGSGVKRFIASHKLLTVGVSAILVTLVFVIAIVISGSGGPALSDSTSCWDWSSASQGQQDDYARMYISEYGELANSDGDPVGTVENAITVGCTTAFNFGEGQVVSLVQAIDHQY